MSIFVPSAEGRKAPYNTNTPEEADVAVEKATTMLRRTSNKNKRGTIPAAWWWRTVADFFVPVSEALARAQKCELQETGHQCGHTFRITVESRMHSGIEGEGPELHKDATWSGDPVAIEVRAHNQRDALLLAATVPLEVWYDKYNSSEDSI